MKFILLYIVMFLTGCSFAYGIFLANKHTQDSTEIITPTSNEISIPKTAFSMEHAPQQSLKGNITQLSGTVEWESRIATVPATLTSSTIQQGEKIITGIDGTVMMTFNEGITSFLNNESEVDIVQTHPTSIVFQQQKGSIEYTNSTTTPLSVRSYRLLLTLKEGTMTINVDPETHIITVDVQKGQAIAGYNNIDFESQIRTITSENQFIFDSDNREGRFN